MNNLTNNFLEYIKRFPTGDNCQPWAFTIEGNKIFGKHNPDRAEHILNRSNVACLISLGFLLQYIESAKKQFNVECNIKRTELDIEIEIISSDSSTVRIPLDGYQKRFCDRRTYTSEITGSEVDELKSEFKNCKIINYKDQSNDFKKRIMNSEKKIWSVGQLFKDFIKWVHFTKKSYSTSKDGLLPTHLNIGLQDVVMLNLFKRFPALLRFVVKSPIYKVIETINKSFYKKSHLVVFETPNYENESILDTAKTIMSFWVQVQEKGYSLQPMNLILLPYVDSIMLNADDKDSKEQIDAISDVFKLNSNPLWVFRIGKNKSNYKKPLTLRI